MYQLSRLDPQLKGWTIFLFVFIIFSGWSETTGENEEEGDDQVRFYLYNNPNNYTVEFGHELDLHELYTIQSSGITPEVPIKFLVHGFEHNYKCWFPQELKDEYFARGFKYNVVAVDWGKWATPKFSVMYPSSVKHVKTTARRLANLISFLRDNQMIYLNRTHLIGFSLGSHVAGLTGKRIREQYAQGQEKIGRITGLDPARPLFNLGKIGGRHLTKYDATFVDVIHTDMGEFGTTLQSGHQDFYVNGGYPPQPGCSSANCKELFWNECGDAISCVVDGVSCSHQAAPNYFLQSIGSQKLRACQCDDEDSAKRRNRCDSCPESVAFGDNAEPGNEGKFYLDMERIKLSGRYTC